MNYRQRKRQRKQERISCNIALLINNSIVCQAFDMSEGGMYVLTDQSFKPGTKIKISLLFSNKTIEIQSKVKYCHEGVGIGITFIDLDDKLKDKIRTLLNNFKQSA